MSEPNRARGRQRRNEGDEGADAGPSASSSAPPLVVTMIRCSTLLLQWGGLSFLTDPWFGMVMRVLPVWRRPGRTPEELPPLDALLVSHLHADHWDEDAIDRLATPPRRAILPPDGLKHVRPRPEIAWEELPPWGSTTVDAPNGGPTVTIHAVPGPHTFPPPDEVNFILDLPGWGRVFVGGDARFESSNLREIGRRFRPIRVALLPVGGTRIFGKRTTMGPDDAREAALLMDAETVVPIHEGGIWMSVPPLSLHPGRNRHLVSMFRKRGEGDRVRVLREGESATFG